MTHPVEANLHTIGRGGAAELFERELQRVLENIKDANTDPKKKRKIKLTFELEPYADRSGANCNIRVETTLQTPNGVSGTVYIGRLGNAYRGFTQDIRQGDLFNSGERGDDPEESASAPAPKERIV